VVVVGSVAFPPVNGDGGLTVVSVDGSGISDQSKERKRRKEEDETPKHTGRLSALSGVN
jgi:hypothetical protein